MSYWTQTKLIDKYGFVVENTPMDEQRVVTPVRLTGVPFNGSTVDANFWSAALGTVAATQANNAITLNPALTNSATTIIQSVRKGRYMPGASNRFRANLSLSAGVANNTRKWGAFDGTDGFYFKLAGTTLSISCMKTGSEVAGYTVASSSFNGSTTLPTLTNINTYEIYYTNTKTWFVINGTLMHTLDTTGGATPTDTLNLPVRMESVNAVTGPATPGTIVCRIASIYRLGEGESIPTYKYIPTNTTTLCKIGPGSIHTITIGNPSAAAVTIYDALSAVGGTEIAVLTSVATSSPYTIDLHTSFYTGLTIVTAASNAVTVIYE